MAEPKHELTEFTDWIIGDVPTKFYPKLTSYIINLLCRSTTQFSSTYLVSNQSSNQTQQLQMLLQSTLGFATRGLAANLDLATSRAVTDICQYISIATLYLPTSNFGPLVVK